jgi:5'-nucleotidase
LNADFETMKLYSKNHLRSIRKQLAARSSFKCKFSNQKKRRIKNCRQAKALCEKFDKRQTPGKRLLLACGRVYKPRQRRRQDEWALENGYISLQFVQFDLTAHHASQLLNTWWNE